MEIERPSLGIIDCYLETPEIKAFNFLSSFLDSQYRVSYHVASQGLEGSLELFSHDAYIVLGSYSHVSESLDWHSWLHKFLMAKLEQNIPVLGICFAHQLLVDRMGGKIDWVNEEQEPSNGSRELKIKPKFQPDFSQPGFKLFHTHSQKVVEVSDDFESMVDSDQHPFDLIMHKNLPLVTLQPHPEYFIDERTQDLNLDPKIMDDGKLIILNLLDFLKRS